MKEILILGGGASFFYLNKITFAKSFDCFQERSFITFLGNSIFFILSLVTRQHVLSRT
jgi:hypothetical protein